MAATDGDAVQAVQQALDEQVQAWNNGDLEQVMAYYWNSPEMLWISKAGMERGHQGVLEMCQADFAAPGQMGSYAYEPLHIEQLSPQAVFYVFKWETRLNGKRMMGGVSSQLWKNIDGNWVITSEHAS